MKKVDFIRRAPGIGDFNNLVEAINTIIDKLNTKVEIEEVIIDRKIKDFSFFKWEEVQLPYNTSITLSTADDASKVFDSYVFSFKEMDKINKLITQWKVVSLIINVEEEITEKDKKQEAVFEVVESVKLDELPKAEKPKKKRWRPKKNKRE